MNSIRDRLTLWLLGGLAIILSAAGAGVYLSVREGLLKSLDAELAVDAQLVRFTSRGDEDSLFPRKPGSRLVQARLPAYGDPDGDSFYQKWNLQGETLERSVSLGDASLNFPSVDLGAAPVFINNTLADGREVREMIFTNANAGIAKGKSRGMVKPKGNGSRGEFGMVTALAKETTEVRNALSSLLSGLVVVGLIAAVGAGLLVRLALSQGLKPLRKLAEQSNQIDADSLDARFDAKGSPAELQPIYKQLNELLHRLESSFERERRFSSDLAHEMRTPVAELKMLNEVALKWPDQAGAETHTENLEIAIQLETMIENLLCLARWESGEMALEVETVGLEQMALDCWKPFQGKAESKGIGVSFRFEADAFLETDPAMLRHIMNNLLSNAAEYTPPDGEIVIQQVPGGFEIANTTSGLVESDVPKLFDRYWRGDAARTDSSHAGLGLSLSKACAVALGLTISAALENDRLHVQVWENRG